MSDLSPLSAVKRKSDLRNVRAAFELKADVSEAGSDVCFWGVKRTCLEAPTLPLLPKADIDYQSTFRTCTGERLSFAQ
jgi:hypothetical protein